ncbi:MAG TPA: type II methionyl aminopeptidase, partial [Patescibacteria group bacterium]|nr:type II methionyl aminopeptidase [Patescibacteria group bacterium]
LHEMEQYDLHSGITIPNIDDGRNEKLKKGLYAIEPFATNGSGKIYEGKPSEIYSLIDEKNPRTPLARDVLNFIIEEYETLPFCSRWIVKKFGAISLFAIKELENNGNIQNYPQLIEVSKAKVSQAENTILVEKGKITVTAE